MIDLFVIFTFSLFLSLAVRSFHSKCISKPGLLTILLWTDYIHSLHSEPSNRPKGACIYFVSCLFAFWL